MNPKFSVIDWGESNTTARNVPENSLTLEKLQAAMRIVRDLPPPPRIDLYPQDLDAQQVFKIDSSRLPHAPFTKSGREMWLAPRARLNEVYRAMLDAGVDVRLEPRYGVTPRDGKGK